MLLIYTQCLQKEEASYVVVVSVQQCNFKNYALHLSITHATLYCYMIQNLTKDIIFSQNCFQKLKVLNEIILK